MTITIEKAGNLQIVHVEGTLDAATAAEFEKEVLPFVQQPLMNTLFDFGKLEYLSSAGLRAMWIIAKEHKKAGNQLALCSLNDIILEVFRISGFNAILKTFKTIEEAKISMGSK
jgi:stage II sporulation protein AA (anti-sigma F factor antagonist)